MSQYLPIMEFLLQQCSHPVPPACFPVQKKVVQTQYFNAKETKSKNEIRVSPVKRRCQDRRNVYSWVVERRESNTCLPILLPVQVSPGQREARSRSLMGELHFSTEPMQGRRQVAP